MVDRACAQRLSSAIVVGYLAAGGRAHIPIVLH